MSTYAYIQQRNESNRKARAFLQDLLTEGPQPYQVVHQQAVAQGIPGGVSNVDIDGNNTLKIKAIGVAISTFETLPWSG